MRSPTFRPPPPLRVRGRPGQPRARGSVSASGPAMKVAVLKGGRGLERQVSLRSGARVEDALRALGHEVAPVDVGADLVATLKARAARGRLRRPARRRRRGRHRSGAARDPSHPLHRSRRPRLRALDRQGRRQARAARRRGADPRLGGVQRGGLPRAGRGRRPRGDRGQPRLPARGQAGGRRLVARGPVRGRGGAGARGAGRRVLLRRPGPARAPPRGPRAGDLADQRDRAAGGRGPAPRRGPLQLRGPLRDRPHGLRLPGGPRRRARASSSTPPCAPGTCSGSTASAAST